MRSDTRARIERATVRLPRLGGQGVLVPGQLIFTAAHVIGWTSKGQMVHGNEAFQELIVAGSQTFAVTPYAVEAVSDIAILGGLDGQGAFTEESEAFEAFCESTQPVVLCTDDFPMRHTFLVHILTHLGQWIKGEA